MTAASAAAVVAEGGAESLRRQKLAEQKDERLQKLNVELLDMRRAHGRLLSAQEATLGVNQKISEQRLPSATSTPCCRSNECAITSPGLSEIGTREETCAPGCT